MTYKLTNFLGINNRLPDSALHIRSRQVQGDYLKDAVNVDIDNAGRLLRRRIAVLVQAMTGAHSLYLTSDTTGYLVRDSVLYSITLTTYSEAIVKVLTSDAAMSYVEFGDDLYYSNGTDSGRVTAGVVYPLGLPTPDAPSLSVIGGSLFAGYYQAAVSYVNTTTGEEGGISGKSQVTLTSEGGVRVLLPGAASGATHLNVYLSNANGSVVYLAATVAVGTPLVDLIALLPSGKEAPERREEPLPAGRLLLSSGRLCSVVGNILYVGIPYKLGYIDPIAYGVPFPDPISVAVDAQAGIFVASDKTYWLPNEGVIADVLPYGAVPGTEFSLPDKTVVGWFGAKGFVLATPSGEVQAVMADNIELMPPTSGLTMLIDDEFDRVVSCGWCMNLENKAATRYTGWPFTSFSRGYGTAPDGLYTLASGSAEWSVDFGKVDLGNDAIKHLPNAYLGVESSDVMQLIVNDDYTYPARSFDEELKTQRIDVGKGLRATWFGLKLTGTEGADFRLAYIDFVPATTQRRI